MEPFHKSRRPWQAREDPSRIEQYFGRARDLAQTLGLKLRLPRTTPDRLNFGKVTNRTLVSAWDSPEYNKFRE